MNGAGSGYETAFQCAQAGIIGAGRVAQAFAAVLSPLSRSKPLLYGRSRAKVDATLAHLPEAQAADQLQQLSTICDLIIIAVSDDALANVVDALAQIAPFTRTPLIVHVSGRSGAAILEPLEHGGALTDALHPAMTFTGKPAIEARRMTSACFAVTGSSADASERAMALVEAIGGTPLIIAEEKRALYHAALCHAANHLVTLMAGAGQLLQPAGIAQQSPVLTPLVRAALENSLANGFDALSGPLLRGDVGTIERHLATLAQRQPDLLPAYRAMALGTVRELERKARDRTAELERLRAVLTT